MKRYFAFLFILLIIYCDMVFSEKRNEPKKQLNTLFAKVNDETISKLELDLFGSILVAQFSGVRPGSDYIKNELIRITILANLANKENIKADKEVATYLKLQEKIYLSKYMEMSSLSRLQPSDADLEKIYNEIPNVIYRIQYILVKDQKKAKSIINKLNKATTFESLAKVYSIDSSGKYGGNLGWVKPIDVDVNLRAALAKLRVGKYTQKPVESSGGWAIAKLEDVRDDKKLPYYKLREQLLKESASQIATEHMESLIADADITIYTSQPKAESSP